MNIIQINGHTIDLREPAREGSAPVLNLTAYKLTSRGIRDTLARASWRLDGPDAEAVAREAVAAWESWAKPARVRARCRVSLSLAWDEPRTDGWSCQLHRMFRDFNVSREVA